MGGPRGVKKGRNVRRPDRRMEDGPPVERPVREDLVRALVLEAYGLVRGEGRVADRTLASLTKRERRLYSNERRRLTEDVYALLRSETRIAYLQRAGIGAAFDTLSVPARHALLYAG